MEIISHFRKVGKIVQSTKNSVLIIQVPSLTFYHICSISHSFPLSVRIHSLHWFFLNPMEPSCRSHHLVTFIKSIAYFPKTKTLSYNQCTNWEVGPGTVVPPRDPRRRLQACPPAEGTLFLSGSEPCLGARVALSCQQLLYFSCPYRFKRA